MDIRGLNGQFNSTLDEKGRILLPSKLREQLKDCSLVLTRGIDKCLWLFPEGEWSKISHLLLDRSSLFKAKSQMIQRRLLAPATELTIDKNGRLKIPSSLQRSAGLIRDCLFIGLDDHVEIWDEEQYVEFEEKCESEVKDAWEEFGDLG
ncbi:MAG: division/cell wall cluster transcriptional repressor MraZ [Spirochaetaceae bacterium]|nr:division/cell wall cluster transcriptional repressor MraZ [Spirochaetaceae bacterium]